jgi:phospholipase/carboxylesterase
MSGFIPEVEGWAPDLEARRGMPVLIAHGTQDPIISADFGRDAARRLREAGLDVSEHISPAGHHIDPRTVPAIVDWLAERPRADAT